MAKKEEPRAPRDSKFGKGAKRGGSVSFETYFLRDLYQRGKIDDKLIAEILTQNQIEASVEQVLAAIKDTTGQSLPRGLARHIADLASVIANHN
jgi:hypothetical protein